MFITGYFYCFCWSALLWSIRLLGNLLSLVLIVFMLLLLLGFIDINQLHWCSWFDVSTGVVDGFLSNFLDGVDVGIRSKMVKRNMESHWWGTNIQDERKIQSKYSNIFKNAWIGDIKFAYIHCYCINHLYVYLCFVYSNALYHCGRFWENGKWK